MKAVVACPSWEDTVLNDAIDQIIDKYKSVIADTEQLRRFLNEEITVFSDPTIVLTTDEIRRDPWWDNLCQSGTVNLVYWGRYYDYMRAKPGWSIRAVDDIDDSTNKVMNATIILSFLFFRMPQLRIRADFLPGNYFLCYYSAGCVKKQSIVAKQPLFYILACIKTNVC